MDPKTAPLDISVPPIDPPMQFLGNKILLLLSLGLLIVGISIALLYRSYFSPSHHLPSPHFTTTHPSNQPPSLAGREQTIFAIGGYYKDKTTNTTPATNSAEFYDFNTSTWHFAPPMLHSHAAAATAVFDNKVYVFGGQESNVYEGTTTVEMFDPTTNQWTFKAPMLHTRLSAQAIPVGSKIYILGGFDANNPEDNSMHIYTPATDSWQVGPSIPYGTDAYIGSRCSAFQDNIYCPGLGEHAYTLVYNPLTNQWQSLSTENRVTTGYFIWTTNDTSLYGVRFAQGNILYQYEPGIDAIHAIKAGNYIDKSYQGFGSVALWDYMFLIGGKFSADPIRDVYLVSLQHPSSWQKTSPLQIGRSEAGIVLLPSLYTGSVATFSATPFQKK